LEWARQERNLTPAVAAKRIGWDESKLLEAEQSDTFVLPQSTIRNIAKCYKLPYGSLFMPDVLPLTRPRTFRSF
jgi:hypothetical protein